MMANPNIDAPNNKTVDPPSETDAGTSVVAENVKLD
jgi:hypothetical protein